jgi:hypothetical protein
MIISAVNKIVKTLETLYHLTVITVHIVHNVSTKRLMNIKQYVQLKGARSQSMDI